MASTSRRTLEEDYIGNSDPSVQAGSERPEAIKNLALGLAAMLGGKMATAPIGGGAPEPAAPTQAREVRTYDDHSDRPKMGAKDYLVQALIPLGTALLGGIGGGNRGAMLGAKSGLEAIGKENDYTRKRYDELDDQKARARSGVITAKVLKDLGGKDGGGDGRNKNRYIFDEAMDPKTKSVYFVKKDRETGSVELVDRAGNLVPYSKDLYDRLRPTGNSSVSELGPPASAPNPPAKAPAPTPAPPKDFKGNVETSIPRLGIGTDKIPTTLPKEVKKPGGSEAPPAPTPENAPVDAKKFGEVPSGLEPDDYDAVLKEFRKGLKPQIDAIQSRINRYAGMVDHPEPMGNENEIDARRRVKNAETALRQAEKEMADFDRRAGEKIAEIQAKKVESGARNERAAASSGAGGAPVGDEFSGRMSQRERDSKLSDKQVEDASDYDKAISAAEDIIGKADDSIVGPLDGRKRGPLLKKGQAEFNSSVGRISDSYRKLITGAGAGNAELRKLESRLPQATDWNKDEFEEKARAYLDTLKRERGIFIENLTRRGKDTRNFQTPATGGGKNPTVDDVDKMSDEEVEAQLRKRGLLK